MGPLRAFRTCCGLLGLCSISGKVTAELQMELPCFAGGFVAIPSRWL